jgi:spermidine synthase
MTKLTPITKCMAHLPLAFHEQPPGSALVICFGMGTSYRSALSWNIKTTAVELVPGVVDVFEFFYSDAPEILANPKGEIVIDDGRRFLARSRQHFDVILIDPPPPVEAAGSSLLYSKEFYVAAKRRLSESGIVQAWIPDRTLGVEAAALRSLSEVFAYVRCFRSLEGWGLHMLASDRPLVGSAAEILARMPESAKKDLLEWEQKYNAQAYLQLLFSGEVQAREILEAYPEIRVTDDEPYNEYYLMRQWGLL